MRIFDLFNSYKLKKKTRDLFEDTRVALQLARNIK